MKPRFATVRELSSQTGYSPSALCKMIPRLHTCGLIHAEVRKERGKDGKEKGNSKYHITIPDIWELNRQFFASSPETQEKMDPSLKLVHENKQDSSKPVHENEQACSPNNTRLFTKTNKPVLFGEQTQAQLELAKDSMKDISKERMKERLTIAQKPSPSLQPEPSSHSFIHSSFLSSSETKSEVVFTPEEETVYHLAEQLNIVYLKRDEKHKESCAKLVAKGVTTQEKMESLIEHCKKVPFLAGKTLNLKNLVNELSGWLQLQRRASAALSSSPVVSTMGIATAEWLVKQEEVRKRIQEKEASDQVTRLKPSEMYKQKMAKAAREQRATDKAK